MFEHMKNYEVLLKKISSWLRPKQSPTDPESLLFIHIFLHRDMPYHFVEDDGWMAQNFFSGQFSTS
jgi:cyclopropane fatty-acyl-phospholipid synthase-like methyltransferase